MGTDDIETRILDAAATLMAHYGYDKTTIDEIAQQAGVAKSTLYTRWKTKDSLFGALVSRELRRFIEDWFARVEADPEGGTFSGIFRNTLLALRANAFVLALYSGNRRVLGTLLSRPEMRDMYAQQTQMTAAMLRLMQTAGTVRADVDLGAVAYVTAALQYGLLKSDEVMADAHIPPVEDVLTVTVDMLRVYLEPPGGGSSEAGKQVIRQIMDQTRAQIDEFGKRQGGI